MNSSKVGHADRPLDRLEQDSLGLGSFAQGLATFVGACDTPFIVAVQGDWGTGKTSLMKMVDTLLSSETRPGGRRVETVWFQTWQYSQFGSMAALPVSLLATLLRCLSPDPGTLAQAKQVMSRLLKPVANAALRFGTGGASELGDFEAMAAKQSVDSAGNANELKKEIAAVVEAKLASGADRIVVFIDDLDRIKPAIAVEILETIKLFVDWPGCVFVLALDYNVVSRGLQQKFGVSEADLGRSFFDKIIQLPFSVPVPRFTVDRYIDGLFRDMALPMGENDGELFAELVRRSVGVNPRGIKRVFNSLQLLIIMAEAQQDRRAIRILFAVLCLQIGFESLNTWLLDRAESLKEADLLMLRDADEDSRDGDLRAAFSRLPEARRSRFAPFAAAFMRGVQDPDRADGEIDDDELARIRAMLKLSRVTSLSGPAAAPERTSDPEFRSRNRQLMAKVRGSLESRLADDMEATGSGFWVNTAHQSANVYLRRHVTADGAMTLVFDHGENDVSLYVEGGKRVLQANAARLRELLQPLAAPWEEGDDEGPLFYRKTLTGMSIDDREQLLLGEVADIYLRAQEALRARYKS